VKFYFIYRIPLKATSIAKHDWSNLTNEMGKNFSVYLTGNFDEESGWTYNFVLCPY